MKKLTNRDLILEKPKDLWRFLSKIVVDTSGCWGWTGSFNHLGYPQFHIKSMKRGAHRVAYSNMVAPIPEGFEVDHIRCSRGCLNPSHLRLVTRKQNNENPQKNLKSNNTSGVRGVSWNKDRNAWRAMVRHNGKSVHVGYFQDISEAEKVVTAKRLELFTHNEIDKTSVIY